MKQDSKDLACSVEEFSALFDSIRKQLAKVIIGMKSVVELSLSAIFAGGHVLLEGAPGLGKTLLVKSIAEVLGLSFQRIQFTSDLMPSDITGTRVLSEDKSGKRTFLFNKGPIFANVVLADEVNRAGPKTQSALLEAMEEKQVSVLGETHSLPKPYFVLATQNPVELEGTYPLPEAQLDRFLFKVIVPVPTASELKKIISRTTSSYQSHMQAIAKGSSDKILKMRNLVRNVALAPPLDDALIGMMSSLTPGSSSASHLVKEYVRFGPGPRGAQSVVLSAKVFALLDKRLNLATEDIIKAMKPALRHRLILNFQAEAEGITADQIIDDITKTK